MRVTSKATPPGSGPEERVALAGLVALFLITAAWWLLALWPVADSPYWLARTRYVCFGVTESGLPDAGGWIGLIGGPLGMLTILLASAGTSLRACLARARTSRTLRYTFRTLALGTLALVLGAGHVVGSSITRERREARAQTIPETGFQRVDRDAPPLRLLAHDGVARDLQGFAGRTVLLTFAYAHCTTVCPLVVNDVLRARELLLEGDAEPPVLLIVTLDPWRDTPSRLPHIAAAWQLPAHDAWLLGGAVADVEGALTAWDVPRSRSERNGEVIHPALVYVIDARGRIAFVATGGAHALAALARRAAQG